MVVGDKDGAHNISAISCQVRKDVSSTLPAGGESYWNGQAVRTSDYQDLDQTPDVVATTTTLLANAAHLGRLLHAEPCPPPG